MSAARLKAAVYGACHADALEIVLGSTPAIAAAVEFIPLDPCMTLTEDGMDEFVSRLPTLDVLIYQPISAASRGERFASAALLRGLGPHAQAISFPYFHFELYTPFVTAPDARMGRTGLDYVDYLLATLVACGLPDEAIVRELLEFQGLEPHAAMIRGASFYELESREERVLPGDRPLDVRITERVRDAHVQRRLCHTNNHPGAEVMGWIGDGVVAQLCARFGLNAPVGPGAVRPDPLDEIDYFAPPFVRRALGLAFHDDPFVSLHGERLSTAGYVARHRPAYEAVSAATLRAIFEDTLPPRPWYGALLDRL